MTSELKDFAARLRTRLQERAQSLAATGPSTAAVQGCTGSPPSVPAGDSICRWADSKFNALAKELFALQFHHNPAYRRICEAAGKTPQSLGHWEDIPAVPTAVFKELDLTCLPQAERTTVFHSSGTTGQSPSRHFHCAASLGLYEASLWNWFVQHLLPCPEVRKAESGLRLLILMPPPDQALRSSLVYMCEVIRRSLGAGDEAFLGQVGEGGAWGLDTECCQEGLRTACIDEKPVMILGTAFGFVHLLDLLEEQSLRLALPMGSRVMETGGYKGRSRNLPRQELHALITDCLGVPAANVVCEYGMSELSSQAYDRSLVSAQGLQPGIRCFRFPPWARVQVISPETGRQVAEGETGLLRVYDLANAWSVMAVQTEDLGVRRGDGFELLGRAARAEPRGCSLMAVDA